MPPIVTIDNAYHIQCVGEPYYRSAEALCEGQDGAELWAQDGLSRDVYTCRDATRSAGAFESGASNAGLSATIISGRPRAGVVVCLTKI